MKLKILLVAETLTTGGAEWFVVNLANSLAVDHDVQIAVLNGDLVETGLSRAISPGIKVSKLILPAKRTIQRADRVFRMARIGFSPFARLQERWLRGVVASMEPDIVHSHLLKADLVAEAVKGQAAHVTTLHGDTNLFFAGLGDPQVLNWKRRAERMFQSIDRIAIITRDQSTVVKAIAPDASGKVRFIYNGVPDRTAVASDNDKIVIGMVSRGIEEKGWQEAIEAFAMINNGHAELRLVGAGPYLDGLDKSQLPPNVHLLGNSDDPTSQIASFDIAILPSKHPTESLPTVIIEYLRAGKPVISSDVGEIAEMVKTDDGETAGILLPLENGRVDPERLAKAMSLLIDDGAKRSEMSGLARQAYGKFAMDRCRDRYLDLYQEAQLNRATRV